METIPLDEPHRQRGPDASPPGIAGFGADDPDVAGPIRAFNAANKTHEELWARVHQAGDAVRRGRDEEQLARQTAGEEHDAHLAIQAEHPNRRAPLFRQIAIAAATVGLDAVACWFAAQALGNGQLETDLWAGLFLAILAGGEVALDYYSDRSRKAWRLLAGGLAAFVAGLGVLRYLFLNTVGTDGGVAALVGAALFTTATAGFMMIGYRALRAGETFAAAQARLRARSAERAARAAAARLARSSAERDRLVDAYLSRIRVFLLRDCTSSELPLLEAAVRAHLSGGETT
jgi:hypothetical protein